MPARASGESPASASAISETAKSGPPGGPLSVSCSANPVFFLAGSNPSAATGNPQELTFFGVSFFARSRGPPNGVDFGVSEGLEGSLSVETPRPDHARRAVDVNRPVWPRAAPGATPTARARTVTAGLTSTARLFTCFWKTSMPWAHIRRPVFDFSVPGGQSSSNRLSCLVQRNRDPRLPNRACVLVGATVVQVSEENF
jgi:hypothetical protein